MDKTKINRRKLSVSAYLHEERKTIRSNKIKKSQLTELELTKCMSIYQRIIFMIFPLNVCLIFLAIFLQITVKMSNFKEDFYNWTILQCYRLAK